MPWDEVAWTFSPYVSWRCGTVPFGALRPLAPAKAWALIEEGHRLRSERGRLKSVLLPRLHAAVPRLPDVRVPLIRLQRELHNDRRPKTTTVSAVRCHLPADLRVVLDAWCENFRSETELMARAQLVLDAELHKADEVLSSLAVNEDIALGLHFSARSLDGNIRRLAASSGDHDDKRLRRARQTLVSLLFRTALKPSPFGTFTDVGAHAWSCSGSRNDRIRRREVRLSRMLLDWMEYELCQLEDCRDQLPLSLNNTVRQREDYVDFLSRGPNGGPHMFGAERFVRIPMTEPLRAILEVASRPTTTDQMVVELGRLGIPASRLRIYLERLGEIGLLERSLGLPDQEPDYAHAMSRALSRLPGERAATCAATLATMGRIESAMAEACSVSRVKLMAELRQEIARFAGLVGRPAPDDTGAPHFYENGYSTGVGPSWDGRMLERERATLGLVTQVFRLFDLCTIERIGLYRLFVEMDEHDAGIDLLDFYHRFAKLGTSAISDLMSGVGDAKADQIRRLARTFLAHLAAHDLSAAIIQLDEGWLRTFVATFPKFLSPLPSLSIRLQRFRGGRADPSWVINGVGPGHGSRFSRFCRASDGENGEWSLKEAVAEQIRRRWPNQADLAVVLGVNTNLHPPLCCTEVEYPRSRASPLARKVLRLRDLAIRADHERSCLTVIDKADGRPIDLVPLTFLFPAGGPNLYRFLFALSPFINPSRRVWDNFPVQQPVAAHTALCLPRIQVGKFVLDRRTWRVSSDLLRPPPSLRPRSVEGMEALARIRASLGLPREGFFRILPDALQSPDAEWADESMYWAVEARRGRRNRPHYVDFSNPLLTEILLKRLADGGTLAFQECLPSTAEYEDDGDLGSAEEYVVELNHCETR